MARIEDALVWAVERLSHASIPSERMTAQLLLAHVIGVERPYVVAHPEHELTDEEADRYKDAVERRASGTPLQYITGKQEFYGLEFEVTPDVLIPRPDTEVIVDGAKRFWSEFAEREGRRVLDLGTGSGAIAVALARELAGARVYATDVSAGALAVARRNAARHRADVRFAVANLVEAFAGPFSLVATNLPYIPMSVVEGLQVEVRDFEPRVALVGGEDGLDLYRRFFDDLPRVLADDGLVLCECGFTQAGALERLAEERGLRFVDRLDDLQGIPRTIVLSREP
jgi:release factor glutamine methyltransferase